MTSHLRSSAVALAFLAGTGVAAAQGNAPGSDNALSPISASQPQSGRQIAQLSPAQKERLFTLIRQSGVDVKPPPSNMLVAIGAEVPPSTELYSMPVAAVQEVPAARPYEFTIVFDTLVLVDPVSRQIVATEWQ